MTSLIWSHKAKEPGGTSLLPFGEIASDTEDFCSSGGPCSVLLQRPQKVPEPCSAVLDASLKPLQMFRFCASVATVTSFQFPSWKTFSHAKSKTSLNVALLLVYDERGKHCGALFNPPVQLSSANDLHDYSLIALSLRKHFEWLEGISASGYDTKESVENGENGCGCWLNIMLVKNSGRYDDIVERVAIGQMHPAAWNSAHPLFRTITMV